MTKRAFIPISLRPQVSGSNFELPTDKEIILKIHNILDDINIESVTNLFIRRKLIAKLLKTGSYLTKNIENQDLGMCLEVLEETLLQSKD